MSKSNPPIAIVTDSTADIPDELLTKHDIYMVNNYVIIEGKSFEDRKDISREQFYNSLPTMRSFPTTATASSGTYQELYERLLSQGKEFILSIHASARLSGIYNAACAAASAFAERVKVIDSLSVSMGLGFQVIAAAEAAREGASLEAIVNMLVELRKRIKLMAMLDTLEYIHRSGRVSWAKARLGELLRIKPFLEVLNGQVMSLGQTRTYQKGVSRLAETLRHLSPFEKLAVLHTNAEDRARQLIEQVRDILPAQVFTVNVTTVIGSHVGPNGLGFAAILKE
ncbi:MAG: DegV family protein [Anaerolineales bacterium]|nr:DegV family protein [Anaerolineales bacterium]MDW8445979.1 DegV family protein [Anaerolineales bacterium]